MLCERGFALGYNNLVVDMLGFRTMKEVSGFNGIFKFDASKPNGTPRKVLNVDKIKSLGWEPKISLEEGIKTTYEWYKDYACQ